MQRQQQVQEIIRCGKDPVYFINTYVKIQHPTRGLVPFDTFDFQDKCLQDFASFKHNIVLKSRQLGLSTLVAAYAVWLSIFYKDKSILVIATKLPTAQNFVRKVKVALQFLPQWLMLPKIISENKSEIKFDNGSSVTAIPTSEDAGRSEALSLLIVDEAAFIRDFEEIWAGVYPTLSAGGNSIIISTPNGVGGQYHKLWVEAESGLNEFNAIKLSWDCHPERDESWYKKTQSNMSKKKFAREYLCDFQMSGDTFLLAEDMEYLRSNIVPPMEKAGADHNVWVWFQPEYGHSYVLSADVSRGDSTDYSTFHIIDVNTGTVVVEYKGKIPPDRFGDLLNEYGLRYHKAIVCPENNTFGYTTCMRLKELKYPRLYYDSSRGGSVVPEYALTEEYKVPGFSMQKGSRMQVMSKLEEALSVRNKNLKVHSQRFYNEMQTFVWTNGKPGAMKDHNDDLVMSLAIGAWVADFAAGSSADAHAMQIAMLRSTAVQRRDLVDIAPSTQAAGPPLHPQMKSILLAPFGARSPEEAAVIKRDPRIKQMNFDWLLK